MFWYLSLTLNMNRSLLKSPNLNRMLYLISWDVKGIEEGQSGLYIANNDEQSTAVGRCTAKCNLKYAWKRSWYN